VTALLLACLLAAGAQAAAGYRVAGVVVNAASGRAVAGARVTLASVERRGEERSTVSGDDGRFAFTGLPQGQYTLAGERRGLLAENYGQRAGRAGIVVAGPERHTESIVLQLQPSAVISGSVVDDAGEPVAGARVELLRSALTGGRRRLGAATFRQTNDAGEYRFSGLAAGSYYLVASGVPWFTRFNQTLGDAAPRSMTHTGYGIRYYPDASDPAGAEPLILKAGQETTADFTFFPVPAASVFVHCEQEGNLTKQYTLTAPGLKGNPVYVRQGSQAGDLYNFWAVPPGHYTVQAEATDGTRSWYGETGFDLAAGDTDVSVTLQKAPSLSGTIALDGGATLPPDSTVLLSSESGRSYKPAIGAAGRFSIPAIAPGRYGVSLSGAGEYFLKNWAAEGGGREGGMLEIPSGAAVRLILTAAHGTGRITGTVNRDGQPLPGALVVLSPADRAVQATALPSNSDGSYEFGGLPPGDYALFAVADGADLEYANPEALQPYLAGARKLHLAAGAAEHVGLEAGTKPGQ